ncbi:hypothetical protein QTN24_01215 [Cupriavidus sp. SZY C1]|uniref:hypothetical protein n=1 Tax=Cupriavidus sp. SZY C1 TaxID=3055037 RepID=UPI0028B67E18|nr:hypothetical protein [Cupriavidus sp. SZY C1]MDT6960104.1 hypothetical protein [Cupriavidus sp. SZY C1]
MAAAGGLAGALYGAMSPERWPASLAIQLPQVGTGMALMDPDTVTHRINIPDFADDVLRAVPAQTHVDARLFRKTLRAEKARGSDIITVRVQGHSPQDARVLAETVVGVLQREHAEDLAKARAFREKALAGAEAELAAAQAARQKIMDSARSTPDVRLAILLSANGREVELLRKRRDELRDQLSPMRTFNTRAIAPVSVAAHPLKESMPICAFIGAAAATLLWGALMLFRKREAATEDGDLSCQVR